jgi:hypothetical protein
LFFDPAISFAKYIKDDLEKNNLLSDRLSQEFEKFYVSSNPQNFKTSSKMFYDVEDIPELLIL